MNNAQEHRHWIFTSSAGADFLFYSSGDKIQAIHMLPGYTHNIINLSETEFAVPFTMKAYWSGKHPELVNCYIRYKVQNGTLCEVQRYDLGDNVGIILGGTYIDNTFYVEVKAKNGTVLGYFIEYVFKEYKYDSDEECNQIGNEIKSKLWR